MNGQRKQLQDSALLERNRWREPTDQEFAGQRVICVARCQRSPYEHSVSRFYLCYSWTNCRNDPRDLVSKTPLSAVVPKREVVIVDQVASPADRASLNFDKNLTLHRFWDRDISFQLDATLSNQLEAAHPVHSLAVNNLRNECTVIF